MKYEITHASAHSYEFPSARRSIVTKTAINELIEVLQAADFAQRPSLCARPDDPWRVHQRKPAMNTIWRGSVV